MKIIKTDAYSITVETTNYSASELENFLGRYYKIKVFAQDNNQLNINCENYDIAELQTRLLQLK